MSLIKKRGQITFFIIIGILILFSIGLLVWLNKSSEFTTDHTQDYDLDSIQLFFDKNLQAVTDTSLYDIGLHGGYIDPEVAASYGDPTGPALTSYTQYFNEKVPIYINDTNSYNYPEISEIEERLEKYILVKFHRSIDMGLFENQGINIIRPNVDFSSEYQIPPDDVSIDVKIRDNDIVVDLEYPLQIEKGNSMTIIKDFSYTAPFRFKLAYDAIVDPNKGLLNGISAKWKEVERMDNTFYLEDFDCDALDQNHLITIYSLNNGNSDERIIRVIDYQNFFNTLHLKGYIYQFAVKRNPTEFSGNICKGTIIN